MKKILGILFISLMLAGNAWGATPEIIWFKCNDDAADTTATNDGSDVNDGTASTNTSNLSIAGKINDAFQFNGSAEYLQFDASIASLANATEGAAVLWVNLTSDSGSDTDQIIGWSNSADSTFIIVRINMGASDRFQILCYVDGAIKWTWTGDNNYLDAWIGNWEHFVLNHNGTTPSIWHDGVDITTANGSFTSSTDLTVWFKGIFTDATADATTATMGAYRGSVTAFYTPVSEDDTRIFTTGLTSQNISDIYNEGSGTETALDDLGASGWTHTINGVVAASMASVNGVAKASIAEINQT